jgi:hypothetical protein
MLCLGALLCSCANNLIRQVVLGKQMWPLAPGLWPLAGTGCSTRHCCARPLPTRVAAGQKKAVATPPGPFTVTPLHRQLPVYTGSDGSTLAPAVR